MGCFYRPYWFSNQSSMECRLMFNLFKHSKCEVTNKLRNVSLVLICVSGLTIPCFPRYGIVPLICGGILCGTATIYEKFKK